MQVYINLLTSKQEILDRLVVSDSTLSLKTNFLDQLDG